MSKLAALLKGISPNRVAVYLTALAGLATAVAPAVAGLDTSSAITVAVGFAGIVQIADRWLKGWQEHEADERYEASRKRI